MTTCHGDAADQTAISAFSQVITTKNLNRFSLKKNRIIICLEYFRNTLDRSVVEDLAQVLSICEKNVGESLSVITESFRAVRNACAGCSANQTAVR